MKIQITLTCNGNDMYRQTQLSSGFIITGKLHFVSSENKTYEILSRRQNRELKYQLGTNRDRKRDVLVYVPRLPFCCTSLFSLFEYNE